MLRHSISLLLLIVIGSCSPGCLTAEDARSILIKQVLHNFQNNNYLLSQLNQAVEENGRLEAKIQIRDKVFRLIAIRRKLLDSLLNKELPQHVPLITYTDSLKSNLYSPASSSFERIFNEMSINFGHPKLYQPR